MRARYSVLGLSLSVTAMACIAVTSAQAKSSKDNLKVGLISYNHVSAVPHVLANIALDDCKVRGWTCELIDGKGDPIATSNAGLNFVNRGFDAILNVVSDNNQLGAVIKAALSSMYAEQKRFLGGMEYEHAFGLYIDSSDGDCAHFRGMEMIIVAERRAYELDYRGGLIRL